MKISIIYASNSGSTYLTAQIIQEGLIKQGHTATLTKAKDASELNITGYNAILLGSPSWLVDSKEGQPHETMLEFLGNHASKLKNMNLAIFGCGDSAYVSFCHAVDYMEKAVRLQNAHVFMPSLKIDSFYFNLDENIHMVSAWAEVLDEELKKL